MKSRYSIVVILLLFISQADAQQWRVELEKHEGKPVREIIKELEDYFGVVGATRENKYHHWCRWREHAINHQNSEGYLFNHTSKNSQLLKRLEKQEVSNANNTQRHFHGKWESVNPDLFLKSNSIIPYVGRINCIAKPSPNSNLIYAGTATGGVWRSINNGASWSPLWDGMVQTGVSSIIVDSTNPAHILAVTGDADSRFIPSNGVYHSYDNGLTWIELWKTSTSSRNFCYKIIQSRSNPSQYYLVGSDRIRRLDTSISPPSITFNGSPNITYYDIEYLTNSNEVLFATASDGLYTKDDNTNWTQVNSSALPTGSFSRTAVAMAPSNENVIYYAVARFPTQTTPAFYGIYKSENKGMSFDSVYTTANPNIMTRQCRYNFTLEVDPYDDDKLYFGGVGLWQSTNGGKNFSAFHEGLHDDVHNSFHINDVHYVCTDGGLSRRNITTNQFESINNGLLSTQFYDIDVSGDKIMGGTQDNGTMFWEEGDAIGYRRLPGDGLDCMFHPTDNNIIFASTQNDKVKSTDFGVSRVSLFQSSWHDPMAFAVDDINKVVMHADSLLRISYDGGDTWPGVSPVFATSRDNARSMSQCKEDPNVLYISRSDSLARSSNFNSTASNIEWTRTSFDDTDNSFMRQVLVHPDSCDVVYAVTSGYQSNQIYKSINGGNTWNQFSEGISNLPVYCIYYDHVNGNGFYIGTELGVFYRNISMSEWLPFSSQLPRVPVYDLKITDSHIYAGTYGRGVWKSQGYKALYEFM